MTYYTYLIGWTKFNKFYYGVKYSKNADPSKFWRTYFTSSEYVKTFRKLNGEPDIIQIRKTFTDSNKAKNWEEKVLRRLNASNRSDFLNERNTPLHFSSKGKSTYIDNAGNKIFTSSSDQRVISGELVSMFRNKICAVNKKGDKSWVDKNDPRLISGELVFNLRNTVAVVDERGNKFRVKKDDPRLLSGELRGHTADRIPVKDQFGNGLLVHKNDPRFLNGELVHVARQLILTKCSITGKKTRCKKDDPRLLSGELVEYNPMKNPESAKKVSQTKLKPTLDKLGMKTVEELHTFIKTNFDPSLSIAENSRRMNLPWHLVSRVIKRNKI